MTLTMLSHSVLSSGYEFRLRMSGRGGTRLGMGCADSAFVTSCLHIFFLWIPVFYTDALFSAISITLLFQQSPHGAHLSLKLGDPGVCSFPLLPLLDRSEDAWAAGASASLANIEIALVG
jgi:hypothetical protein